MSRAFGMGLSSFGKELIFTDGPWHKSALDDFVALPARNSCVEVPMQPMPITVRISLWAWLITALLVGRQHWLVPLLGPALQGVIFGLTALVLLLCFKNRT